jgi:hypothetical protein
LTDGSGTPLTGSKDIIIQLWDRKVGGDTPLCSTLPSQHNLVGGAFQIEMPDNCAAAVHQKQDIWIEAFIDGASVGRNKLGAVPFALEAGNGLPTCPAGQMIRSTGTGWQCQAGLGGLVQSGVFISHWYDKPDAPGYQLMVGTGNRSEAFRINFSQTFADKPEVVVGISEFDINGDGNRATIHAESIDKNGFSIRIETWANSSINSIQANWIAYSP